MANRKKQEPKPPSSEPTSLRSLGEYLNLSPATISLVLNNAPGVRSIPQETRNRVLEAAAKFEYRPSFYARSLRKRQSFLVGVLVPELNDSYTTQVLAGVENLLIEEGYFYLTASHRRKPDLIEEYSLMLLARQVEGLIMIDTQLTKSIKLPVVAVAGHRQIEGVTNVALDQRRAAELILRHLYKLGHRKIAFMRGGSHSSDADERWKCLMAVAADMRIEVLPELSVQVMSRQASPELGLDPTRVLLKSGIPFTALVCYNDLAAIGASRVIREHGLRVPEDISLMGFDDIESASYNTPSLTTIRQPLQQIGSIAAHILLKRIRGPETFSDVTPILPELLVRESTGPPATARSHRKNN